MPKEPAPPSPLPRGPYKYQDECAPHVPDKYGMCWHCGVVVDLSQPKPEPEVPTC